MRKLSKIKRQPISLSRSSSIKTSYLNSETTLPLIVQPIIENLDLVYWLENNQQFVEKELFKHGAILFRGFKIDNVVAFEKCSLKICSQLFSENGEHPRENLSENIYTPVFYPAKKQLLWHNENSFNLRWPMKILFGCLQPASQGGETTIVNSRKVFEALDPRIKDKFIQKQVMYVRNYVEDLGRNWQTIFQTTNPSKVNDICQQSAIAFEWQPNGQLKTRSVRPAVVRHPVTNEISWFNQAQHWHPACLDAEDREYLFSLYKQEDLPRNCHYGDGTPIEDEIMEAICEVYQQLEVAIPWEAGDILVLDNILTAHGRNPYVGTRKLLVAVGDMTSFEEIKLRSS
ncbi:MAG: TauD/TfdA family dioxygenase [Cyanobacteria bacterium P01_F01_bin.143]